MQIYLQQIFVLVSIVIINCIWHGFVTHKSLRSYFKETLKKDWIANSYTILIWAAGASFVILLTKSNLTPLKNNTSHGYILKLLWFSLIFFVHGIYIYFSHRSMHKINFLRKFHGIHHFYREQTPLSSWSIHPIEAVIDTFGIIVIAFIVPVPLEVYVFYTFFSFQINIWAHFSLNENNNKWLRRFINFAGNYQHHNIHHYNGNKNFGAFIMIDYLLKTYTNKYPR